MDGMPLAVRIPKRGEDVEHAAAEHEQVPDEVREANSVVGIAYSSTRLPPRTRVATTSLVAPCFDARQTVKGAAEMASRTPDLWLMGLATSSPNDCWR